jgi:hypothetical protein
VLYIFSFLIWIKVKFKIEFNFLVSV